MLSSRGKIRLALLIVAAISVGTSFIALFYINNMVERTNIIVNRDAKLTGLAEDISIKMLEARREEKNFIIYFDSSYIENNRRLMEDIKSDINEARAIGKDYSLILDSIERFATEYSNNIELLVKFSYEDPRALNQLQRRIISYEEELKKLAQKGKIKTDSLPAWTSDLGILMLSATTKLSSEKEKVITELRETSNSILRLNKEITTKSRQSLAKNSSESVRYGVKAQRNAMIIFLITGFLLIYLIFYFPERVFLPFRRMMKTLKAIAKGENNFTFPDANTKDELGELSRGVQDTISKLRYFNDLKTDKIIETERKLRRVSEEIAEPVLILSADLKISYLNEPAQKLFSLKEEVIDKDIKDIPALSDIFGEQLADIEKKGRIEFQMKNKKLSFRKKNVIIIPNINKDSKTESILIIVK